MISLVCIFVFCILVIVSMIFFLFSIGLCFWGGGVKVILFVLGFLWVVMWIKVVLFSFFRKWVFVVFCLIRGLILIILVIFWVFLLVWFSFVINFGFCFFLSFIKLIFGFLIIIVFFWLWYLGGYLKIFFIIDKDGNICILCFFVRFLLFLFLRVMKGILWSFLFGIIMRFLVVWLWNV